MLVSELYNLFRSDVADTVKPYLWSDNEVYDYMNDAYRMFVRKTGGIPDASSSFLRIPIVATVAYANISPLILKFRIASLESTGADIKIINAEDVDKIMRNDYGSYSPVNVNTPGPVTHMVIGLERTADSALVRWVQKPIVNDYANLIVYRLPKDKVTADAQDFNFREINEEHHVHLMHWMKHRAYGKQDAETFDKGKREEFRLAFENYCAMATDENDRYKSKPVRTVRYGGI